MTDQVLAIILATVFLNFFCIVGCALFLYKLASMVFCNPMQQIQQPQQLATGPLPDFYLQDEEEEEAEPDNIDALINSAINEGTIKNVLVNAKQLQKEGIIGDITVRNLEERETA